MKTIKPGDIGLTTIGGTLGWWVSLGQHLAGDSSRYTHTFIVLDDNTVLAAQPGGARIDSLDLYKNKAIFLQMDLSDEKRAGIIKVAKSLLGTPYSFLDYLSLALLRFGIKPKWLRKYIANSGHMICSQLCDYVYYKNDVHLFNDGREFMDVTPGDLANWIVEHDWIEI